MKAWSEAEAGTTDIEQLVYLSHLIGGDLSLVQPGGGNTSVKLSEPDIFGTDVPALVVKGSGTDLRTISPDGFTHLYADRLALLRERGSMSDEGMMEVMRACMLFPDRDPVPSVETPLHALLPARFVAHTHDVATLSLSDTPNAEANVRRVFGPEVAFLEYVRPGFPLAKRLAQLFPEGPPKGAIALVMEKHGLAVWGETARQCYGNLRAVIGQAEAFLAEEQTEKALPNALVAPAFDDPERRDLAAAIMPVVRGRLQAQGFGCVLQLDDSPETLKAIGGETFSEIAERGVMTPEHILRAGARPLVVALDAKSDADAQQSRKSSRKAKTEEATPTETTATPVDAATLRDAVREALDGHQDSYQGYAERYGHEPISDSLKTVIVPHVGVVYAGTDRRNALIARDCYRATMAVMAGAETIERFEFISEADQAEMEYWPLERRKIEESAKSRRELDGKVVFVIGAASGIGRATAMRFVDAGAHIVAADLEGGAAEGFAWEINERTPERALGLSLDVSDSNAAAEAVREAVLHFGGIDVLFYSPGVGPEYHSVVEMPDEEIERKMAVHYKGAVATTREVARVLVEQGQGGRLIYNASKAAYAPGEGFAAYGASKAALVHYVRNVANELGQHGITANYINADAIDTPMFREVLRQRAERAEASEEDMLARYAERSALREATVPPEAVAEAALWLASDRSAHTTGCVITVGGGAEGFPR
jgi:rhamnose utilization protein RhaD (predicted bifunctional aldolase and dehydrogenase)/NAD(P)-dependent dehydrogenase (short-subunit alcohol dehydrogenase family)